MPVDALTTALACAAATYTLAGAALVPRLLRHARALAAPDGLVALAALLLFFGMFVWWEQASTADPTNRSALLQLICFSIAGGLLTLTVFTQPLRTDQGSFPALFLYLYGTAAVISAAASPHFLLSLYDAALTILDLMLALVAIAAMRGRERALLLLRVVIGSIGLIVLLEAIGVVLFREETFRSISGGGIGLIINGVLPYMNANELGFLAGVAVIFGLIGLASPVDLVLRAFYGAQLTMAGILLYLAQARTTLVGLVAILLLAVAWFPRMRVCAGVVVLAALVAIFATDEGSQTWRSHVEALSQYFYRGASEDELATLSGRTQLWTAGWKMFNDAPLFGHGYGAGVRFIGHEYGLPPGTHMHNTFMQVLADTGLVGLIALLGFIVSTLGSFAKQLMFHVRASSYRSADRLFLVGVGMTLILIMIKTTTGSMLVNHQPAVLITIAALAYAALAKDRSSGSSWHGAVTRTRVSAITPLEEAEHASPSAQMQTFESRARGSLPA